MNRRKLFESENCKQSGITLIALVISIIVMLILAGVSLNATIGDNGIITQAQNAKKIQEYIEDVYIKLGFDVVFTSAKNNIGIDILKEKIKGKTVAFSGNSGVGKSSITKCYIKDKKIEAEVIE